MRLLDTSTACRAEVTDLRLARGEVHLWWIRLAASRAAAARIEKMLSADETLRAAGFAFDDDRSAFILRRGVLRAVLASYLGSPAKDLLFECGPQGKPALAGCPLVFNSSHSQGTALIAVTTCGEVGVDIERLRPLNDAGSIAQRFFTAAEYTDWLSVSSGLRTEAFFNCWTRKESFVKAIGSGLSTPLDSFRVSLAPNEPAALLEVNGSAHAAEKWSMLDVKGDPNFAGCVAVNSSRGQSANTKMFRMDSVEMCFESLERPTRHRLSPFVVNAPDREMIRAGNEEPSSTNLGENYG